MILITGHRGFIGSRITKDLTDLGIKWVGFDLVDGNDIRNPMQLDQVFEKYQVDTVLHLGALAGVRRGEDYPQDYFDTNVIGTENVLRMAKKYKVKQVILFSSSSIYGEDGPASMYGISKLAMEQTAKRYKDDIERIYIVRPFTVYGENGRRDQVIYKWINHIKEDKKIPFYGDGKSFRPYTYVGDVSDAIVKMFSCKTKGVVVFEIGGKEPVRLSFLLKIFKDRLGLIVDYLPMPKMDSMGRLPDMENAKTLLGWFPKQDFKTKVLEIIDNEICL
jgi:UDP-glucuronate 4-epimerase